MNRTLRAGAGAALVAALVLAGCQANEPEPIPTAVLPTPTPAAPTSPTSGPSTSDRPTDEAVTEAARTYLKGRVLAEDLYKAGSRDRLAELQEYFVDPYLSYWREDLVAYLERDLDYTGSVGLDIVSAKGYLRDTDKESFVLVTCIDFSDVESRDPSGGTVDKPFELAVEEVTVQKLKGDERWLASAAQTRPVESFEGSQCAGV